MVLWDHDSMLLAAPKREILESGNS